MFEPEEDSLVLEIVRGFFDISPEDMMKIGDQIKEALFATGVGGEEAAVERLKAALADMSKEHALIAGMFISGLLRCNLAEPSLRCAQEAAEGGQGPD